MIDRDWLKYVDNGLDSYFQICELDIDRSQLHDYLKERLKRRKVYSCYEMDDLLLGHFEDLGMFVEMGVLDSSMVYGMFSSYVVNVWENDEIKKYIRAEQQRDRTLYVHSEFLYDQCRKVKKKTC